MTGLSTKNATESWGKAMPDWIRVLAAECDKTSQNKVSDEIGYSNGTVNTVLKNTYKGDLKKIESAVRGRYMNASVICPVLGKIASHTCVQHQRAKFMATNSTRVRLYKACRNGCAHSTLENGGQS